ncbi:hypothetical protein QAD02_023283 [Eretmocerus hayati]|uniref:Uncharacterized protein n=1 Tax=Eretmocerus hayati TaxID=131215 RepID=A0ACC2PV65_9HYME|nr:hypothetical protein QAD02_023283 [Eretmocerus hayati]
MESQSKLNMELLEAVRKDDQDRARQLIKNGANVNARDSQLKTCLHYAVEVKNLEIVCSLLDAHAELNTCDNDQYTALQMAILAQEPEIVKLLIHAGANVNAKRLKYYHRLYEARSVLHDAVAWADVEVVKLLLKHGAKVEIESDELIPFVHQRAEPSILYIAAANKCCKKHGTENDSYLEILKLILSHNPNINEVQKHTVNLTPFNVVVRTGNLDAVLLFLDHDIDFGEFDHNGVSRFPNGASPLHLAVLNCHETVIEHLLDLRHWDINGLTQEGLTPLLTAFVVNKPNYMKVLLSKGADAEVPFGPALIVSASFNPGAVLNESFECLKILFDAGADFEEALEYALNLNHTTAIKCIIKFISRMESNGSIEKIVRNFYECMWAQRYYQECEAELNLLRGSMISQDSISFYDFLVANDHTVYAKNLSMIESLSSTKNFVKSFPIYGIEINNRYIKVRNSSKLWEQALIGLKCLFGFDSDALRVVNDNVLQWLNKEDLRNICVV